MSYPSPSSKIMLNCHCKNWALVIPPGNESPFFSVILATSLICPIVSGSSEPNTSYRLQFASASTTRIGSFFCFTNVSIKSPVRLVLPTPPFPATAML